MQGKECLMNTFLFTSVILNSIYLYMLFKNSKSGVKHTGCLESRFTKNKKNLEISELV